MKLRALKAAFIKERYFFMAIPAVVWQLLFFYIPLACLIFTSFTQGWVQQWWPILTLQHYTEFFDLMYVRIIGRSLTLALGTALLCLVLAYPVAYYLALKIHTLQNVLLFFLIFPFWTSLLIQVYAWFFVLEKYGLLNSLLLKLSIIQEPLHLINTPFAVYLVMVYCYLPFMIMPLYAILEQLDIRLIEAALDLGASPLRMFLRVIVPLSLPGIMTGFFLVFIAAFGEFVIPALLGGAKQFFVGSLISHYYSKNGG